MDEYRDFRLWEETQAEYTNPVGANASERAANAIAAAQRMHEIEARWEFLPGGFLAVRERHARIERIVAGSPPFTDEELIDLARLLYGYPDHAGLPAGSGSTSD